MCHKEYSTMSYCELCRKDGHVVFECDSDRANIITEAVGHWVGLRLNEYQWNSAQNVHKELFTETQNIRRLSKGDLLYLLRGFIDPLNWCEFSKMYCRDQYLYFYLGYKTREFIGSPEYERLNESSKLRLRADMQYWLNRACFSQEVADELWLIELEEYNPPDNGVGVIQTSDCAICLRDNLERGEMALFSCGHNFCTGCSHTMVLRMTPIICPLCRGCVNQIIQYQNNGNFSVRSI
jgi:hypothetical protein